MPDKFRLRRGNDFDYPCPRLPTDQEVFEQLWTVHKEGHQIPNCVGTFFECAEYLKTHFPEAEIIVDRRLS